MSRCVICKQEIMPDLVYHQFQSGDVVCEECASDKAETISWSPEKLKEFKKLYEECQEDIFVYERSAFDKGYAKYLIEFLAGKFGEVQS